MRILPFIDIPVIEDTLPSSRLPELIEWSEGDKIKLSAAFIAYENEGEDIEDYLFQIGYIKEDCLVTTKELIELVGTICMSCSGLEEYAGLLPLLQAHIDLYFQKINSVPPWGSAEFLHLQLAGKTVRTLQGPHKTGKLKPNQKRLVILNDKREFVFGPLLK